MIYFKIFDDDVHAILKFNFLLILFVTLTVWNNCLWSAQLNLTKKVVWSGMIWKKKLDKVTLNVCFISTEQFLQQMKKTCTAIPESTLFLRIWFCNIGCVNLLKNNQDDHVTIVKVNCINSIHVYKKDVDSVSWF